MTTDTVGGVWNFSLDLARHFRAMGIEVTLAALGGMPSASQSAEAEAVPNLRFCPSNFKLEWMEDPWSDVERSGRWLLDLERQYRPELVHLNTFGHGHLPWTTPVLLTAHSCVLSWWAAVRGEAAPAVWDRYRNLVTHSLDSVDLVTSPSRAMADSLVKHYACKTPIEVIPNGRPHGLFHSETKQPFIMTAGRLWDEAKNLNAVSAVAKEIGWPIYAAGNAHDPQGRIKQLSGVCLLGSLNPQELASWFSRAAIFASPARYEPFGLSALEAGLSGCALVLGDIPSLREVWGDAAVFVAPNDHVALKGALQSLIEDDSLRADVSRRSYERALRYSVSNSAQMYLDSYEAIVEYRCLLCAS